MSQDSEEEVPQDEASDGADPLSNDDVPDNPLITAASRGDDPLGMFASDNGAAAAPISVPEFELPALDEPLPPMVTEHRDEKADTGDEKTPEAQADEAPDSAAFQTTPHAAPVEAEAATTLPAAPVEPRTGTTVDVAPVEARTAPEAETAAHDPFHIDRRPPMPAHERLVRPAPRRERDESGSADARAGDSRPLMRPPAVALETPEREPAGSFAGGTQPPAESWQPTPDEWRPREGRTPRSLAAGPRRRLPLPVLVAAAIVVVAAAVFGGWRLVRGFSAPPAAPAPQEGKLTVDSQPSGAAVEIDGVARGTTPVALVVKAGRHVMRVGGETGRQIDVVVAAGGEVAHHIELAEIHTRLHVTTVPSNAAVRVDGQARGNSPLDLDNVAPGPHTVTVDGGGATVRREVEVRAGTDNSVVISLGGGGPTTGWVTVASPFDVDVYDGSRLLGRSRDGQMLVVSGPHELTLTNDALGYKDTSKVTVTAGATATVRVQPRNGQLSINANPWADVFLDNQPIGQTPIANYAAPIGAHEIRLVHPQLGERRQTVTITLKEPTRVGVNFNQR